MVFVLYPERVVKSTRTPLVFVSSNAASAGFYQLFAIFLPFSLFYSKYGRPVPDMPVPVCGLRN